MVDPAILDYFATLSDLEDLVARFQAPLYYYHHTWLEPLQVLVRRFLEATCGMDSTLALHSFAAFLLLPGLIERMRFQPEKAKIVEFLRSAAVHPTPAPTS